MEIDMGKTVLCRCSDPSVSTAKLPPPVPELPVSDIGAATKAYASEMGFIVDWSYENFLAGISRDSARVFLRRRTEQDDRERYSVIVWLNMASSAEVDQLYEEWKTRGVVIIEELHTAPYNLRQFIAQDIDSNRFRVFHDLGASSARKVGPTHIIHNFGASQFLTCMDPGPKEDRQWTAD